MRRVESPGRVEPVVRGPAATAAAGLEPVELRQLSRAALTAMAAAGQELAELQRVLGKTADNVVGLLLEDAGAFYEWTHYPAGDVYDFASGAQYYYHAHPKEERPVEHGHFHTFLRPRGMPKGIKPALVRGYVAPEDANDALSHLVAVAMSDKGQPFQLFTTNRWVTGETWYAAHDVIAMLDRFAVELVRPSFAVNRWITALVRLFRPQIEALVLERDRVIAQWQRRNAKLDVFEDRRLAVASKIDISLEAQLDQVLAALKRTRR